MSFLSSFYPQPVVAGTTEGTFAEGNHSHELDELDASGISSGKVLTANGLDAASWEDPTGEVEEAPEDGDTYGRKDAEWTPVLTLQDDGSIEAIVTVRQGTAAQLNDIVLSNGEIAVETFSGNPFALRVGDGATSGGKVPSGWISVASGVGDVQTVENSTTLQEITLFSQFSLERGAFYSFVVRANFEVSGAGGIKISAGIGILTRCVASIDGDWEPVGLYPTRDGNTIFYNQEVTDASSVTISGIARCPLVGEGDNRFVLSFAQSVASAEGYARFLENSYLGFRKIS